MSKRIVLFIISIFMITLSFAQEPANFQVPLPGNSKFIDNKDLVMGGRNIQVSLYQCEDEPSKIADFYRNYFTEKEFTKTMDKKDSKAGIHRLRFKKDELVVSFAIRPDAANSELVIAKYAQMPGEPEPEDTKPSVKDSLFALPKKDIPGFDLSNVPRPPESVRMVSTRMGKSAILLYATSLSVEELMSFYQDNLSSEGWVLQNEQAAKDGVEAYINNTKKTSLGFGSPFSDGEDLESIIKDSYILTYKSSSSSLKITVFPNLFDRKLGAFVQINLR